jgi:2-succinyl-6-hydroxy-2,4-cyclohexadiene-1-carboxylate synthase
VDPRRLVLLHGFTQNASCWGRFAELSSDGRDVVAFDLPGHGARSDVRADLWESADLVADSCGPADYVGYSLGGRLLLHLALARTEVVGRAVLIGASPGIDDPLERAARIESDELIAKELEAADPAAFESFLRRWLSDPLFAGLTDETSFVGARLGNDPVGLASSLRLCGTGAQQPLSDRLGSIQVPVLVLAGELDEKFRVIGEQVVAAIGENAAFRTVPRAHHACHLEQPEETALLVRDFLGPAPR